MTARTFFKTATYRVCHIGVASTLAYLLTSDLAAALSIGLLEPSVQAVVFLLHEHAWERSTIGELRRLNVG
jgi:uncharacterized membrane protein